MDEMQLELFDDIGDAELEGLTNDLMLAVNTSMVDVARTHGYAHCLMAYVPCPFTDETLVEAWNYGRDCGRAYYLENVSKDVMFGGEFEKGM